MHDDFEPGHPSNAEFQSKWAPAEITPAEQKNSATYAVRKTHMGTQQGYQSRCVIVGRADKRTASTHYTDSKMYRYASRFSSRTLSASALTTFSSLNSTQPAPSVRMCAT